MYESPLSRIYGEIQTNIIEHEENKIVQAVQNCGISVNKEELIKALMYDRQQYEKGYADAKAEQGWIPCSEGLPDVGRDVLITKEPFKIKGYEQEVIKAKRSADPRSGKIEWWSPECGTLTNEAVLAWMPLPEKYSGE